MPADSAPATSPTTKKITKISQEHHPSYGAAAHGAPDDAHEAAHSSKSGDLVPGLIWRGLYLDDNRVFYGQEDVYTPNFTVDIMLDASASRGEYQRVIAAQAYVIAEALRACGIPYQIYSFCTLRGYTVMTLYQSYRKKEKARVF